MAPARLAPLLTAVFGLTFVACSGSDERPDGGSNTPTDSGVDAGPEDTGLPPADAGTPDTGPRDCTGNPFRCAPMQLMDSECVCLEECEGALRWNPATGMCEMPPAGECNTSMDCNQFEACVDVPPSGNLGECTGQVTCRCLAECDPWVSFQRSGCGPTIDLGNGEVPAACTWLGDDTLPTALCLPEGTGGEQGATCGNTMPCNRSQNYLCVLFGGVSPGTCVRVCDPDQPTDVCETIGPHVCGEKGVLMNSPDIGLCSNPPIADDLGTTCTSSTTCQGGVCSQILMNSCTQPCGGVDLCADGALCINITGAPPEETSICALECDSPDAVGDAQCRARGNTGLVCRPLLQGGGGLCSPPCNVNFACPMGTTCDAASGRCM